MIEKIGGCALISAAVGVAYLGVADLWKGIPSGLVLFGMALLFFDAGRSALCYEAPTRNT